MPLSIAGIRVQASGSNPYFPQSKQNWLPSRPDDSSMQKKAPRECWLDRGAAARLGWGQELSGAEHSNGGNRMSPTWARKESKRWRYCVSQAALQGDKSKAGSIVRVPAADETLVTEAFAK